MKGEELIQRASIKNLFLSRVNTAREHLTPSQLTDRPPEALKRLGKHMNFFVIFQEV